MRYWCCTAILVAGAVLAVAQSTPSSLAQLLAGFENPPDEARIMMRWWWFGPSVVKPELEREMRRNHRQLGKSPLAAFHLKLLRHRDLQQMADR